MRSRLGLIIPSLSFLRCWGRRRFNADGVWGFVLQTLYLFKTRRLGYIGRFRSCPVLIPRIWLRRYPYDALETADDLALVGHRSQVQHQLVSQRLCLLPLALALSLGEMKLSFSLPFFFSPFGLYPHFFQRPHVIST